MTASPKTAEPTAIAAAPDHGMRPIATAFVLCNFAVLAVLAVVIATGHLETNGALDLAVATAMAAPTQ